MLYYVYVMVIYDGMCVKDMLMCEDVFLTIMKTLLISCQKVVGVFGDGYNCLMAENGTYGALWDYL